MIRKDDVPYCFQPCAQKILLLLVVIGCLLIVVFVPSARPYILEAAIGVGLGVPAGSLFSKTLISYISQISLTSKNKPSLKWLSCIGFPVQLNAGYADNVMARIVVVVLALCAAGLLEIAWNTMHNLPVPFARFAIAERNGESIPSQSMASTFLVYFLTIVIIITRKTINWYNKLPD